ncbi:MAG: C25 family cysteine peptidase [Bacteroidales bacterium]
MKKNGLLLPFILIFCNIQAENWTKIQQDAQTEPKIQMVPSDKNTEIIKFEVNAYKLERVQTPRGIAHTIQSPEASPLLESGAPDIPKLTTSLIIPNDKATEIEVVYSDYTEIHDIDIAPSKGNLLRTQDPDLVPFTYGEAYQQNAFFPASEADASDPYIIRNFRGQSVTVFPFRYNPVEKVLRIYTDITVKITSSSDATTVNALDNTTQPEMTSDFVDIYKNHFINYSEDKYTPLEEGTPGRMLIISHADFMDEMADYVQWKRQKGIETEMVDITDVGSNAADIASYIETEFTTNGLNYVLLVGDAAQVPTNETGSDSDNEYVYLLGDDHYADCFIGRLSAETGADVTNQVNKIIEYERDYDNTNTWIENAFGSASSEGGGGQGDDDESDVEHMDNIATDLETYGYTVTNVNQDGGSNAQISAAVNAGTSVMNYVGHGSETTWVNTGFSNTDVNALTNTNVYPFIWSVACVNGDFKNATCFAEAWQRASDNGNPTGSVGILASTINQSWASPMAAQDEMNDLLVESYTDNIKRTFGGLSFNGIFLMIDEYTSDGENMADTWTLFGDPSMMVRTKTPADMTVTHNGVLNVGVATYTVNCDAEGALVSLSKEEDGETIILGTDYISGGSATVDIDAFNAPGNMKITVTAFDKVTYQDDVMVIVPDGPYVVLNQVIVDDADGNSDGQLNNNESVLLDISLENVGVDTAYAVSADISTGNTELSILDNTADYGDMNADAIATQDDAYAISLADGLADQSIIPIEFLITDNDSGSWTASHNLVVHAPDPELSFVEVDDAAGNGNGILDPGETADIIFQIENAGHNVAVSGNCDILIAENASAENSSASVSDIAAGDATTVTYTINVDEGVPAGSNMPANLTYTSGAYSAELEINLPIGLQMETWESEDFLTYDWENDENNPWIIVTDEVYEGEHASKSGDITHDQTSALTINLDVTTAGEVSFFKKVSCEAGEEWWGSYYWYDNLAFYIDDNLEGQWDGEVDWSQESYPVSTGQHELKWEYVKDAVESGGQDAAWIDDIILPPHDQVTMIRQNQVDVSDFEFSISPNPVAEMAHIKFDLDKAAEVDIRLLDVHGRQIRSLYNQDSPEGQYQVAFDVSSLPAGMYIVSLNAGQKQITEQLIITK